MVGVTITEHYDEGVEGCPVSKDVYGHVRCGLPLHLAPESIDPVPVCLMHSIDPAKQEGELLEKFWDNFEQILTEAGENKANFFWYVFPAVRLSLREIKPACDFTYATFTAASDFSEATFVREVEFIYVTFTCKVSFKNSKFTQATNFWHATFTEDADFTGANFAATVRFDDATLTRTAYFHDASFGAYADFRDTTFNSQTYFTGAKFTQMADFRRLKAMQDIHFLKTTFMDEVSFNEAAFMQIADFNESTFHLEASFKFTAFHQRALFVTTVFLEDVKFVNAEFGEIAAFADTIFTGLADYGGTTFSGEARWEGSRFLNGAQFRNTSFLPGHPHNFYLTSFAKPSEIFFDDVDLSHVSFEKCDVSMVRFTSSVSWGKLNGRKAVIIQETALRGAKFPKYTTVAQTYQQLKKNYDNQLDYWTANEFHFGEMEMLRLDVPQNGPLLWLRQWWHQKLSLVALYRWGSNYGNSFQRPLWWLAAVLLLFAMMFPLAGLSHSVLQGTITSVTVETFTSAFRAGSSGPDKVKFVTRAFGHGLLTAIDTASFQRNIEYAPVYPWGRVMAIGETLITSTLVALFFLALKRQFRR